MSLRLATLQNGKISLLTVECATDDAAEQQQEKKCSVNVEKWKTKVPSAF